MTDHVEIGDIVKFKFGSDCATTQRYGYFVYRQTPVLFMVKLMSPMYPPESVTEYGRGGKDVHCELLWRLQSYMLHGVGIHDFTGDSEIWG